MRTARLVSSAAAIVGMHSDAATEPIVDLAMRLGVPFAVIPCCVLPNLFPNRTVRAGKGLRQNVRSYRAFCQYLLEKAPSSEPFQTANLSFAGKNKVIFSLPPQALAAADSCGARCWQCGLASDD